MSIGEGVLKLCTAARNSSFIVCSVGQSPRETERQREEGKAQRFLPSS
jgi:hypothetical protein